MMNKRRRIVQIKVTKSFGDLLVLDRLGFSVYENEFLCVVGPTGCGKTTLVNLIAGLLAPTSGSVTIDGSLADPRQHNISLVFQEPSCLPWMTVWDNIRFGLEIRGIGEEENNRRVKEVVDLVALKGFENYYPRQISGGMKQRVAIARAFVTRPDLLLMDEPFGHLDAQTRYYLQIEVLKIWQRLKTTVIFVTNDIEEAVFLSTRVLTLAQIPARIRGEVLVDLSRPRDNTDPRFIAVRKRIDELCAVTE